MIEYLEGREKKYREPKEELAVGKMARDYALHDGILVTRQPYGEEKGQRLLAVVPNGFRTALISENHDTPSGGHRDKETTVSFLRRFYYWPGMGRDVKKFEEGVKESS